MSEERTVLLGGSGRFGRAYLAAYPETLHPTRDEVDVTRASEVQKYLQKTSPRRVIHAAAVVGRREAEADRAETYRVNVLGTASIARACREISARLIYISSAAVFDGENGSYTEADLPSPRYYYAWTKLLGEQSTAAATDDHAIVRADFFVPGASKHTRLFVDHYCSKIPVDRFVQAVSRIAESDFRGVVHVGCERLSLFEAMQNDLPGVQGIRIAESEMPDFPRDLSLDCRLYRERFGEL